MAGKVQSGIVSVESIAVASTRTVSGVIFDVDEGGNVYIFTECSATRYSDQVNITFDNGLTYPAAVVGFDEETNLALLTCTPGFTVEPLHAGSSALVKQGDYVVGIGGRSMRTLNASIYSGICSASGFRHITADSLWAAEMLDFDAVLQSESEGGALFNVNGDLLGMLVTAPAECFGGRTYAVAIDEMKIVYSEMMQEGNVSRTALGLVGSDVAQLHAYEKSARNLKLDMTSGVLVTHIYNGSPLEEIMVKDDVLIMINDMEIKDQLTLRETMYSLTPGEPIVLKFIHEGEEKTESVQLS